MFGEQNQGTFQIVNKINSLFVAIVPNCDVHLREISAKERQELLIFTEEFIKNLEKKDLLRVGIDFEERVDDTCCIGFDHHDGKQRPFVFSGVRIGFLRGLSYVLDYLSGNFQGIRNIL